MNLSISHRVPNLCLANAVTNFLVLLGLPTVTWSKRVRNGVSIKVYAMKMSALP